MTRAAAIAALVACAATASAAPRPGHWLREHGTFEWSIGTGGWRSSLGVDPQVPGFDALGGGGEIFVGLDFGHGLGLVAGGRVVAGKQAEAVYLEGLGSLGLQLRVSELVRLRAGAAAGQARVTPESGADPARVRPADAAVLVGGFVMASIDLFSLGAGRLAMALSARLDLDAHVAEARREVRSLPDNSLALAVGLGLRY